MLDLSFFQGFAVFYMYVLILRTLSQHGNSDYKNRLIRALSHGPAPEFGVMAVNRRIPQKLETLTA